MNPGELLEISGYFWKTCVLHAAVKLDVFTVIGDAHLTAEDISQKLSGSKRGVERLLNALTGMDLLVKTDGKYANSPPGKTFLTKDSAKYIGHIIMHHNHLLESWSQLDQAVLSGRPVRNRSSFSNVLEPGGMIIIHDFILNNSMDGPLFPALFSLNMLLGTDSGQSYSEDQIIDMLADAGVKDTRRIAVQSPNDSGIIMGEV